MNKEIESSRMATLESITSVMLGLDLKMLVCANLQFYAEI